MPEEFKEPGAPDGEIPAKPIEPENPKPESDPDAAAEVYGSHSDPYGQLSEPEVTSYPAEPVHTEPDSEPAEESTAVAVVPSPPAVSEVEASPMEVMPAPAYVPAPPKPPSPPPPPADEDDDPEEEGMLRMSFMDHLGELRSRLLKAIGGVLVAFILALTFCSPLWKIIAAPAVDALKQLGVNPPKLAILSPTEGFNVIYLKLPLLVSIFIGSPWIFYQLWAFISPGLYKREKRWAVPFILSTAGLFIAGGCFAYFVAFRYGLVFLLGVGLGDDVTPVVSIDEYFDLFVNVTLGVGLVFEMPVIIFFLTLLRLASPRFLIRHSRYAILAITIIAAIVTPTPDIFNMMIFAVPMVLLFFIGVFLSYLLVLRREGKNFPWGIVTLVLLALLAALAGAAAVLILRYHYHPIPAWPFLVR
jgi:sec-independent protein translocase protein TatC